MTKPDETPAPHPLDVAMGMHIRQRRKALGVSQSALAEAIGLTFQQIQKYERGFNRVSFSRLVDIAHALDCRVVELIGDLDSTVPESPLFRADSAHLRVEGAAELLAAFAVAPSPIKRGILKLVQLLAQDQKTRAPVANEVASKA